MILDWTSSGPSVLASFMASTVEFVEALPRSFNGKIDKKALRAPFWPRAGTPQ